MQGNRGELFAAQVARANAAIKGEDIVTAEDLQMGVKLCILPRGTGPLRPPAAELLDGPQSRKWRETDAADAAAAAAAVASRQAPPQRTPPGWAPRPPAASPAAAATASIIDSM